MFRFCIAFLICGILHVHGNYSPSGGLPALLEALDKVKSKETLNYGNSCSYNDELKRIEATNQIANQGLTFDSNLQNHLDDLTKKLNQLSSTVGSLCNSQKLFQCGRNGKCGCSNTNYMGLQIRSSQENGSCRLNRGNMCVPQDSLQSLGSSKPDIKCGAGTTCKLRSTGGICTTPTMTQEILKSIDRSDFRNMQKNIVAKMKDTCQCLA